MTDSTLTPSQAAREAVLSSGFPLAREGREAIENREWEHHYLLQAFALFEESIHEKYEKIIDTLENLIIGIGMGWDLEGMIAEAEQALEDIKKEK